MATKGPVGEAYCQERAIIKLSGSKSSTTVIYIQPASGVSIRSTTRMLVWLMLSDREFWSPLHSLCQLVDVALLCFDVGTTKEEERSTYSFTIS